MGTDIYVELVLVNSTKDFPFLRAVLEKNAEKDMVFGMECYTFENVENESVFEWDFNVGISESDVRKEIERQKVQMDKEGEWEEEDFHRLQYNYVNFMISHECYGYSYCVAL
jgi:hypothetical protein